MGDRGLASIALRKLFRDLKLQSEGFRSRGTLFK